MKRKQKKNKRKENKESEPIYTQKINTNDWYNRESKSKRNQEYDRLGCDEEDDA